MMSSYAAIKSFPSLSSLIFLVILLGALVAVRVSNFAITDKVFLVSIEKSFMLSFESEY